MVDVVTCPNCDASRPVIRVHPRLVDEIYADVTPTKGVGLTRAKDPSDRAVFYCRDCGTDFTAVGVTWWENFG